MIVYGVEMKAQHDSSLAHDMVKMKFMRQTHVYVCLYVYK